MTMNIPKVIRIEPAGSCNLECTHCPTGRREVGRVGVMRQETFEAIFRSIAPYAPFRSIVLYHGGEPLLNRRLGAMSRRLRPLTKWLKTVTNGTLLDIDAARELSAFDEVEVSLDGNSAEENDAIRIGARFAQIVANVHGLLEVCDPTLKITIVATKVSCHGVPQHLRKAFAGVVDRVTFKIVPELVWPKMQKGDRGLGTRIYTADTDFCDHTYSTMTFRWNGDVVPCCYDLASQAVMGNIESMSIESIWSGERFQEFRSAIASKQPPSLCQGCRVLYA